MNRLTKILLALISLLNFSSCKHEPEACFEVGSETLYYVEDIEFLDCSKYGDRAEWDFGDGLNSSQFEPKHRYALPGVYVVVQRVFNDNGEDDFTRTINIGRYRFIGFKNTITTISDSVPNGAIAKCGSLDLFFDGKLSGNGRRHDKDDADCPEIQPIYDGHSIGDNISSMFLRMYWDIYSGQTYLSGYQDTLWTSVNNLDLSNKLYFSGIEFANSDSSVVVTSDIEFAWTTY